ncbi:hypothetical protein BDY24DRAFT_173938 [Mrakia frigida]|uniref:uncharacterized protein n=1 Tax=Mrakia frigida TaxID=29902 RepID=UPI003FCBF401
MSQGYALPPSHQKYRPSSSSRSSSSSSSSSTIPNRPPLLSSLSSSSSSIGRSSHQFSPLMPPHSSRENPICIDLDSPEPEELPRPSRQLLPPPPPNAALPFQLQPARPSALAKRRLGSDLTAQEIAGKTREEEAAEGRRGEEARRIPWPSNDERAVGLASGWLIESQVTNEITSRSLRPFGTPSSPTSNSSSSTLKSWTQPSNQHRFSKAEKGKGREEPRGGAHQLSTQMLPPPPPPPPPHASSNLVASESQPRPSRMDVFFSRPPPPPDNLPMHLSRQISSSRASLNSSSTSASPAPSTFNSVSWTRPSSSSTSRPSERRLPSSTPVTFSIGTSSSSKAFSFETDGVECISDLLPPPVASNSRRPTASNLKRRPSSAASNRRRRSPSAASIHSSVSFFRFNKRARKPLDFCSPVAVPRGAGSGLDAAWLTGQLASMSVDERDGEKDNLESWLRHALLRAPPAVDAERRRENEEPRVSSSSSVTAPPSSFVKSNPTKPQLSQPSESSSSSSSASKKTQGSKPSLLWNLPTQVGAASSSFVVTRRAPEKFSFNFTTFAAEDLVTPLSTSRPVVASSSTIIKKLLQDPSIPEASGSHHRRTRAVKRGGGSKPAGVIDISDSDEDGISEAVLPISRVPRLRLPRRRLPPPSKLLPPSIQQHPRLQAFQKQIDLRLAATNSAPVRFFNELNESIPNAFVYSESRILKVGGERNSTASSSSSKPCDCPHCGKGGGATGLTREVGFISFCFALYLLPSSMLTSPVALIHLGTG